MVKLDDEYIEVIKKTRQLIDSDREWIARYRKYIQKINDNHEQLKEARHAFYVPKPFKLYMPISKAMNSVFNLRICGQDVADLKINTYNKVSIRFNKNAGNIFKLMSDEDKKYFYNLKDEFYPWKGKEARRFRRIFKEVPSEKLCGQPEHKLESYLLDNYLQKSSQGKEILNIQPITMLKGSGFFQMPTPLKASGAKNGIDNIEYAKFYGGGIDILARVGRGIGTQLAILELKDENRSSEPPEEAIKQAIAYATFIRELLRSEVGKTYWRFFGFTRKLPEKLALKAIIVMPYKNGVDTDFAKISLPIADTTDSIKLGYIYRKDDGQEPEVCF